MKKKVILLILILSAWCIWTAGVFAQEAPLVNMDESWVKPDVNFNLFDELYIFNIDLRDLVVSVLYDGEDEAANDEVIGQESMENVAMTIFQSYSDELQGIIPLSQDDIAPADFKDRNAMILNIKLSGKIDIQDKRLLMELLQGEESPQAELTIEGSMLDSKTKDAIMTFRDKKEALIGSDPFSTPEDIETLSKLTDTWAASLATFLFTARR